MKVESTNVEIKHEPPNCGKRVLPAVFLDGNGNELKKGDKVIMTLYGLGSGEMDIVENEGELCLYDATQGHYPLKFVVKRDDMFLERLS
jgi:hypothetical protein